jgi:purine-binding chemotaxis protein CheW
VSRGSGFLIVRAGARRVGLGLAHVLGVVEPGPAYPVPASEPAVRGVALLRGRLVPLVHLGALLERRPCPVARGDAAVVTTVGEALLCFEVEGVERVARESGIPVPAAAGLPGALGVAPTPDGPVPLLDVGALGARLTGEDGR